MLTTKNYILTRYYKVWKGRHQIYSAVITAGMADTTSTMKGCFEIQPGNFSQSGNHYKLGSEALDIYANVHEGSNGVMRIIWSDNEHWVFIGVVGIV